MATPPILEIDALIAPIPGDEPAGTPVPYDVRQRLEEARKELNPESFAPDDPMRPEQPKWADWGGIIELAQETLTQTSKDLLTAARLTEALTKVHGFAGCRDGVQLLRRLVEEAWDRIHPATEDGDVEVRAAAFNWLDDPDRGSRFPTTVRSAGLVSLDGVDLGWIHWRQAQEGKGNVSREDFDRAVAATPRQRCQDVLEDLVEGEQNLQQLSDSLGNLMGDLAPGLTEVRRAFQECRTLAEQILGRKGPGPSAETESDSQENGTIATDGEATGHPVRDGARRRLNTREEVYAQLAEAASVLQRMEPHSPIPYLIQRAVQLGALPFPELIKVLVRDVSVLTELNRELGIQSPEEATPQEE